MARRRKSRAEEPRYEAFAVLEETEGPLGPETFSASFTEPRLAHRCRGRGANRVEEWFVDGLPVASRQAADAALLLPPLPDAVPPTPRPASPEDEDALRRLVAAFGVADARRDHEAAMAAHAKAVAERRPEEGEDPS